VAKGRAFECLLTGDQEICRLNRAFRRKQGPTDVLSFPSAASQRGYLGEIAISWERAEEQALAYGHSTAQEIQILMLHGLLHLLGYDHETDRGRMVRAEIAWRRKFDLPNGLLERNRP
jgi:probable rRNA maturation factor